MSQENQGQQPRRKKRKAEGNPPAPSEAEQEPEEPEEAAIVPVQAPPDSPEEPDAPEAPEEPAESEDPTQLGPMGAVKQTMAKIHKALVEHGFRPHDAEELLNRYAALHTLFTALVKRHDSNEKLLKKTDDARNEIEEIVEMILQTED